MTPGERRRRATKLCVELARAVAKIAPEGVGRWDPTWEIVGASNAEFMLTLALWEADPTEDAQARTKAAYNAVLDAWRKAVSAWESIEA